MIMALESSGTQVTGDSVETKLLQESSYFDKSKTSTNSDVAYQVKCKPGAAKSRPPLKNVRCWNCNKLGHISSECRRKDGKNNKDSKDNKRSDHEKKKSDSDAKVAFLANN